MLFFHYVARKLVRRIGNNALTVSVIGFVLAGCILGVSFLMGLRAAAKESFPAEHVLVLGRGANTESSSKGLALDAVRQIEVMPGIRGGDKKAFSQELTAQVLLDREITASKQEEPQFLRGVDPIAYEIHGAKIVEGRMPEANSTELIAGAQVLRRHPGLKVGTKIQFPGEEWTVVGIFSAGGSTYEAELWGDRSRIAKPLKLERVNSVILAANSPAEAAELAKKISESKAFEADAHLEREFRGSQAKLAQVTKIILMLVIILCVIGVFVTATNLHASLVTRMPEFASLITLGVRRNRVAGLVLMESLLLALIGAALAVLLAFLVHGKSSAAFNSIAVFDLSIGVVPLGIGVGLAVFVGLLGGLFPALIVKRLDLIRGLR